MMCTFEIHYCPGNVLLNQNYKLVITGQSLGAGAAAILALLLKQEPQYKDILQCFAFSPPGGLMRYMYLELTQHDGVMLCITLVEDLKTRASTEHVCTRCYY